MPRPGVAEVTSTLEEPPFIEPPPLPAPEGTPPRGRNPLVWLFNLYFRPSRALDSRALAMNGGAVALMAWIVGAAGVAGRMGGKSQADKTFAQLAGDWSYYWGYVLGAGLIAGLVAAFVPSLWYHLRIRMCGGAGATLLQTRRLYLGVSLVWALPVLLGTAGATIVFETPGEADAGVFWPLVVASLVTPFWSLWASYRGARTALGTRRWPSVFWLLALPGAFYAVVFVAAAAIGLTRGSRPDFDDVQSYRTSGIRHLMVPGNWTVAPAEGEWMPSWSMQASDEWGNASFTARMSYEDLPHEQRLAEIIASFENVGAEIGSRRTLRHWGSFAGAGVVIDGELEGTPYELRALVFSIEEGVSGEFISAAPAGDGHARKAVERLGGGVTFVPLERQAPDVEITAPWHNRYFSLTSPGNWHRQPTEEAGGFGPGIDCTSPQGSYHRATVYDTEASPMEEVLATVQMHAEGAQGVSILESPVAYGVLPCAGQVVRIERAEEDAYTLSVYAVPLADGRTLEINEIVIAASASVVAPGMELLRTSLALKEGITVDESRLVAPPGAEPGSGKPPSPRF